MGRKEGAIVKGGDFCRKARGHPTARRPDWRRGSRAQVEPWGANAARTMGRRGARQSQQAQTARIARHKARGQPWTRRKSGKSAHRRGATMDGGLHIARPHAKKNAASPPIGMKFLDRLAGN
ncbi:hypothetical protein ANO11243_003120 [Dothideomycetidae sp. 11243]|nr:hypothetical protein ANO11243_003120 [fungal sp. No.11243]